jgi:hypothetical protein
MILPTVPGMMTLWAVLEYTSYLDVNPLFLRTSPLAAALFSSSSLDVTRYQAFLNFLMLHPLHYHIDMDAIQSRLEQFLDRRLSLAQAAMSGIATIEFCGGPERQLTDGPYFPLRQTDPVAFGSPPTAERFRDTRMHAPI